MFCSLSKISRLVPTLGEDLLLAVLNYPGSLFHRQSTMISVGRLSLLTLPSGLTTHSVTRSVTSSVKHVTHCAFVLIGSKFHRSIKVNQNEVGSLYQIAKNKRYKA